jgi:hypothetical protein
MIKSSPSRTARVRMLAGSLPASGSVWAKQNFISPRSTGLRKRSFCSSLQ